MRLKSTPYFLLIMLLVLGSCSKKTNVPVPADAAIVIHINGKSLHSKLSWDEFKQGDLYKAAAETFVDSLARKILDNPENTGIDIQSDAFFFARVHGRGGYSAFTGNVKDEKAFADFLTKASEGKEITKQGALSVLKLAPEAILTWNSTRFVFIGDTPDLNNASAFGMNKSGSYQDRKFPEDSLIKFASEVYDIKGDKSVGSDKRFADMMKEPGDGHMWANAGRLYGKSLPGVMSMIKASLLFEGNASATTMNFENGKITVSTKGYFNKELAALLKKHSMKNIDEDMLKSISSDNVAAVLAMNYPPEGLKEFLSLMGVDGLLNAGLAELGYSVEEFTKATKGDLLLAYTDFEYGPKPTAITTPDDEFTYTTNKPGGKILFAASVNDKPSFEKLITLLQEKIGEAGSNVQQMTGKIPYQLKDKWFVAGSDSDIVNGFGASSKNHAFISKISGHPFGAYADIQKFIGGSRASIKDSAAAVIADASMKFWQDVVIYGGETKGDAMTSTMEINLVDKNTNSLKQLNDYLGVVAKTFNEKRKEKVRTTSEIPDSVSVAPVNPN